MSEQSVIVPVEASPGPDVSRRTLLAGAMATVGLTLTGCSAETGAAPLDGAQPEVTAASSPSTAEAPNPALLESDNEVLRGLGELEGRCGQKIFNGGNMEFFRLSSNKAELREDMDWHPAALDQAVTAGMQSTIILEPAEGQDMSRQTAETPNTYFAALYEKGVRAGGTPNPLGRVVICPEYIEGGWKGSDPAFYVHDVNLQLAALKAHFPDARASVMVDMNRDEASVLVPAVHNSKVGAEPIRSNLLDSVGVQAFSNRVGIPIGSNGEADVSHFLDAEKIKVVAAAFGKKNIWINTGIPKADLYAGTNYSVEERTAIAHAITNVVQRLQADGLTVDVVNLFAQDKSGTERIDFSFPAGHESALISLSEGLNTLGVPLSGFVTKLSE